MSGLRGARKVIARGVGGRADVPIRTVARRPHLQSMQLLR